MAYLLTPRFNVHCSLYLRVALHHCHAHFDSWNGSPYTMPFYFEPPMNIIINEYNHIMNIIVTNLNFIYDMLMNFQLLLTTNINFLKFLNNGHTNIKFTIKKQINHSMTFLDVFISGISHQNLTLQTYHKLAYTGLL